MSTFPPPAPIGLNQLCMRRPGYGKEGRPTKVQVNHFHVDYKKHMDFYHYDVSFAKTGDKPLNEDGFSRALCETILKLALHEQKAQFQGIDVVSDGRKNIFAAQKLPFQSIVLKNIILPEDKGLDTKKNRGFDVYIKASDPIAVKMTALEQFFNGKLNYTPYDCIQALDVALRHTSAQRFVAVGRNFFSNEYAKGISDCAEIWYGFHQSLRPTQSGLTLNIDTAATAFVKAMPVVNFIAEALGQRDCPTTLTPRDNQFCTKALRGVKISVTHRGNIKRAYRVNGLSKEPADKLFFESDKGRVSVAQYFAENYKRLRYPQLPCLHVGAVSGNNYLPVEVCCTVEGQKVPRRLTEKQVADMIKVTCLKPAERVQRILSRLPSMNFSGDVHSKAFGLSANSNMIEAEARVLNPPDLLYGNKNVECPRAGQWNMKSKLFFMPKAIESMAVISCATRLPEDRIKNFLDQLRKMMLSLGMKTIGGPPPIVYQNRETISSTYSRAIQEAGKKFKKDPQLILVIKPTTDAISYGEIKRASDTIYGVVSQCVLAKHVEKANMQYIANLLMKINTKLGGRNAVVNGRLPCVSDQPTIVFGADVTHPSPTDKTKPSIAAVVASTDSWIIHHAAAIRKQGHRVEQIEDLKSMAVSLLKRFYICTKRKPARIIFYRDGVSEGQFQMVLQHEIRALKEACRSLEKDYCPPITFVIVQKRHHTRMFPMNPKDMDRSGNCMPGTLIEKNICHPHEYDFYLMSHSGIQGTSRPTHYHVLVDENKFTVDDLQSTTYRLCYTFARCTRSVSIVPAAYYAHLVAFRARFFLEETGSDKGSIAGSSKNGDQPPALCRMAVVSSKLDQVMYYV